jgi:polyhydroxyalkanoate synthesis repressor PhaR
MHRLCAVFIFKILKMLEPVITRIIKRYPNRRLYDVHASKYVNLADLRELVVAGVSFQVLVDKTNEDQTKNVLMQIFLELELGGQPIFSDQSLKNLIVMNNTFSNDLTQTYLSRTFELFKFKP